MENDKKYLVVVECAIEYENKFLIIQRPLNKHAGGLLSFPGGKVEAKDEIHDFDILRSAAKREICEEVGIILNENLRYITSNYFIDIYGNHVINSLFHCILDVSPQVIASKCEVSKYFWMTYNEINLSHNTPEWLKRYIMLIKS